MKNKRTATNLNEFQRLRDKKNGAILYSPFNHFTPRYLGSFDMIISRIPLIKIADSRRLCHFIHVPDHEYFFNNAVGVCSKGENFIVADLSFTHVIVGVLGITVLH